VGLISKVRESPENFFSNVILSYNKPSYLSNLSQSVFFCIFRLLMEQYNTKSWRSFSRKFTQHQGSIRKVNRSSIVSCLLVYATTGYGLEISR